jgi:UDP-GlcNAc:undecaprenyl-phosphate GlcNAc-1-phosphate transferase
MNITFFITIVIVSILLHYLLLPNAHKLGLIDTPNERSMHKRQTPRGAGIAIFLSVMIVQSIFNWDQIMSHILIYSAITFVFIIGVLDDLFDVSPRIKFAVLFFASILVYFQGIHIDSLGNYFGFEMALPLFILFPFTFFAITGLTNAFNLIDGLDGLAGSIGLIIMTTFLWIGLANNDTLIITLSASFIAAVISFLVFNWNPAQIFMGDSGSLTLGFVISILSILSLQYATPTSVLFIVAVPLLDTFVVMTRRIQRGHSPFKADKNHLHHFLYGVKGNVRLTVILLISIQAIFSIIGFQLREEDDFLSIILFGLLFFVFLNLFDQRLKHRKKPKKFKRYRRALRGLQKDQLEDEIVNPNPIIAAQSASELK